MGLDSPSEDPSFEIDTLPYSRWQDIFRSWFWRYYDHLFVVLFYNLGWFFCCFGVSWVAGRFGVWSGNPLSHLPTLYLVYVLECVVSIPWAILVFRLFMSERTGRTDLLESLRKFYGKALLSASLSGFVLFLGFYNLYFYFSMQGTMPVFAFVLIGFVVTLLAYLLMMTFYLWPILFFQDLSFGKLIYRSFIVTLGTGPTSLGLLFFSAFFALLFSLGPFLWFMTGLVFFFSLYTVALEKHFLRYKITYKDRSIDECIEEVKVERQRGWRDIFKPWETR